MKALPMPSGKDEGTANFPYQILLVKFHLQYRNGEGKLTGTFMHEVRVLFKVI